jgi:hypothetical protein
MSDKRRFGRLTVFILFLAAVAILLAVAIPAFLANKAIAGARKIGQEINEVLNFTPQITVNNKIVVEQQTPILELATVSRQFNHQYEWNYQWLKSTKRITITSSYEAKAGFDLNKKFEISIRGDKAVVTLPQPQLLSVEPQGDMTFEGEHGLWNWIDDNDRAQAVNACHQHAREFAKTVIYEDAKIRAEEQLRKILESHGKEVEFHYTEAVSRDL